MADKIRNMESENSLVETLQRELNSAQDVVNALTSQNTELKSMMSQAEGVKTSEDSDSSDSNNKQSDMVSALSASVRQLELERNQVIDQLSEEKKIRHTLQGQVEQLMVDKDMNAPAKLNGMQVTKDQYETLQKAMKMLEDKYTTVMKDKADLSDANEQLEHTVLQLQGETDTIGEYITLYHHQRALLQQREQQKEEYIVRLARDREMMQAKLAELQQLVMKLLQERNMLHSYNNTTIPDDHGRYHTDVHTQEMDDWPDYNSDSGTDSDVSEVEAIVAVHDHHHVDNNNVDVDKEHVDRLHNVDKNMDGIHIPMEDNTAQKIMHLLNEIGTGNIVDSPSFNDRNFLPCKCCTGKLLVV